MEISKTKIEKRTRYKMDETLIKTIIKLKKTNPVVAKELARPKRRWPSINLREIDMVKGDVLVVGKVLGAGELENSKKIVAWSVSENALEKILSAKGTFTTIKEEIKKNPKLNGLDILR
ncbi:MAG: uL15 family ribosomal protein [archaeon]|nr:uL15 family ribosomal protein [archaeon]